MVLPSRNRQPASTPVKQQQYILLLLMLLIVLVRGQDNLGPSPSPESVNRNTEGPTPISIEPQSDFQGIPGTTQTTDGYDTSLGNDAICWVGQTNLTADDHNNSSEPSTLSSASHPVDLVKEVFPNPLVADFVFLETRILSDCPSQNTITIQKPVEALREERLRTLEYYDYTIHVEIDLDTLDGDHLITDDRNDTVALQVVVCSLGKSGFCSPFVHEQANYKDALGKVKRGEDLTATAKSVKGNLHGDTHIHSPWVFKSLNGQRQWSENVTVSLLVNIPGDYFVIGTVQLYTSINNTAAYRWDMSNALDAGEGRYVLYQDPADINEVSNESLYISYVIIAIAASILLFLIGQTVSNRGHQVLQLSQGDFLLVFLVCALVATCSSSLLAPQNDLYCRISCPLLIIPIQLMYAITVGRLWRIHAVISPLLLEHMSKGQPGIVQRFVGALTVVSFQINNLFTVKKQDMRRSTKGPKQQISQFQLAYVVAIFAFPQVIIQIMALIFQPRELYIELNDYESIGRATCSSGMSAGTNLIYYGYLTFLLLVVILLVMAHSSRKLPSLFNETGVIYDSTFLSVILLLLGGAVIALTDTPTASPDVEYMISIVLVLSLTLNSGMRIMLPKLKRVWKNETVIVSKLVTDHHRKARERRESTAVMGVSGFDPSDSRVQHSFNGGDYDLSQSNGLLPRNYHSNSMEFAGRSSILSGKSSQVSGSEDGVPSIKDVNKKYNITPINENPHRASASSFAGDEEDQPIYHTRTDDLLTDMLESEQLVTPEDEVPAHGNAPGDVKAAAPASAKATKAESESTDQPSLEVESPKATVATSGGHASGDGGTTDDELDLEKAAAVAVAPNVDPIERTDDKKSFFDRGASGFLKNVMSKGMSFKLSSKGFGAGGSGELTEKEPEKDEVTKAPDHRRRKTSRRRIAERMVVTEDETPARRLVLKMLDLQDQLEAVNNKIMSGEAVPKDEWRVITKLTEKLDRTFNEEVEFEWETVKKYEESLRLVMPPDMAGTPTGSAAFDIPETKLPNRKDSKKAKEENRPRAMIRGGSGVPDQSSSRSMPKPLQKQVSSGSDFADEPKVALAKEPTDQYFT